MHSTLVLINFMCISVKASTKMAIYRQNRAKKPILGQKNKTNPCSDWSCLVSVTVPLLNSLILEVHITII